MNKKSLTIAHGKKLTIAEILDVGVDGAKVELSSRTKALLRKNRQDIMDYVNETDEPAYGFNRGFGHNVKLAIGKHGAEDLQRNLILSHACGFGEYIGEEISRITMLLRAKSLAQGHSGVRPEVVETIIKYLNHGVIPVIPRLGSVSASGDLAPLSHMALGLIGEGRAHYKGKVVDVKKALKAEGISPLTLQAKEGLALNNGIQYSNAIAIFCWNKINTLLQSACLATAMSAQVMLGSDTPYQDDLHALRPHQGSTRVARTIHKLMRKSPIREAHRPYEIDGEIQDPYNLRCAAQILGACDELLARAVRTFEIEANSVTDNPVILAKAGSSKITNIVSGGHFHGMPVAIDLYGLLQAAGIMSSLTNARCQRYVDEDRNKGLGSDLKWPGLTDDPGLLQNQALWSGMMIPEYVSAGLTNYIWGACMPTHLMSISTDAGQEDHVSMAANLGIRLIDIIPRLGDVLAIEFAFIGQAAAIRKQMEYIPSKIAHTDGGYQVKRYYWKKNQRSLNDVGERALKVIYSAFPPMTEDRYMCEQLANLSTIVQQGGLVGDEMGPRGAA